MDANLFLKCVTDAWFLVNGRLVENGSGVSVERDQAVCVTVFPVNPALLPYSARLIDRSVSPDNALVSVVEVGQNCSVALFDSRYECVFSPESYKKPHVFCDGLVCEFFWLVKSGDVNGARSMMSEELSDSVDDGALSAFFDGYKSIFKADFLSTERNSYMLVTDDDRATPLSVVMVGDKIDDVEV